MSPIDDTNIRSRSPSSDGSHRSNPDRSVSRNQSISPARNRSDSKSSAHNSSVSSVSEHDDDKDNMQNGEKRTDGQRVISHEDLSDVSDLESPLSHHDDDEKGDEQENVSFEMFCRIGCRQCDLRNVFDFRMTKSTLKVPSPICDKNWMSEKIN